MQKIDDAQLLLHDYLVNVCMDLVDVEEEEVELVKDDMSEMVQLLFESLDARYISRSTDENNGTVFHCELTIPNLQ
jgi:hypothetical protein